MDSTARSKRRTTVGEKSRNPSINKSSTVLVLNKQTKHVKSITPLKCVQHSYRGGEPSVTPREKALMKQNLELKKENAELVRLLKRSKELIKDEIGRCSAENQTMRRFVEAAWSLTEGRVEEKLREQVRSIVGSNKVNTNATANTESQSSPGEREREDTIALRNELRSMDSKNRMLRGQVGELRSEGRTVAQYVSFVVRNRGGKKPEEALPVDSANVGSESDEDVGDSKKGRSEEGPQLPGFMKSLMLKE